MLVLVGTLLLVVLTRWLLPLLARSQIGGSLLIFLSLLAFSFELWSADIACPEVCQPVWPACWIDTSDRSSSSGSRAVKDAWDVYRDELA